MTTIYILLIMYYGVREPVVFQEHFSSIENCQTAGKIIEKWKEYSRTVCVAK